MDGFLLVPQKAIPAEEELDEGGKSDLGAVR
jgi:hypothetical protein